MTPNDLIDKGYMAKMKGAALPCYLFIVRKTRGWSKSSDNISTSQLVAATGYQKDAVLAGVDLLIKMGIVEKVSFQNRPSKYTLTDNVITVGNSDSGNSASGKTDTAVGNSDSNLSEKPTHNSNIKTTNTKTSVSSCAKTENEKFSAKKFMMENGVSEKTAQEFIDLKNKKRKTITDRSLKIIFNQAIEAKLSNERVFQIIVLRGWESFKAAWNWAETNAEIEKLENPQATQPEQQDQPAPVFKGVAKKFKGMSND